MSVLVLTYWSYHDALIQTYSLPYLKIILKNLPSGSSLFLVTMEKDKSVLSGEENAKIAAALRDNNISWLPFPYRPFGLVAFFLMGEIFFKLSRVILINKISTIHCWCTPPGAIGYFLSVFLSRRLILDSYEPHAEAMVENGTWKRKGVAFQLLFWLERLQTKRATYVISATKGMKDYAMAKYHVRINNFFVKPACVDLELFNETAIGNIELRKQLKLDNKVVCVYAGKFGGIYLKKEIFAFAKAAIDHWGDVFRFLVLTNHSCEEIKQYCDEAGVPIDYLVIRFVPHSQIPQYIGLANFALTPVKPIPTKRYCTPIKDGEYWALGLPVVIPEGVSDDAMIVRENSIGAVLNQLNEKAYKRAIDEIDKLLSLPKQMLFNRIRSVAKQYRSYMIAEEVYRKIYGLTND